MIAEVNASCCTSTEEELQARYLALLPRIEAHARIHFRTVVCTQKRADLIAESVALAWHWFRCLAARGRDGTRFPTALAAYAARAVQSGRRLCGQERARDAMSPAAQQRHGFVVGTLPEISTESGNSLAEALHDNTRSAVPDQVQFRFDFPAWARRYPRRNRRLIGRLMLGERTGDAARRFGLSPARVSQLRRRFCTDWHAFGG
jgi:hypothetical protein